jgi:hypothetical protein
MRSLLIRNLSWWTAFVKTFVVTCATVSDRWVAKVNPLIFTVLMRICRGGVTIRGVAVSSQLIAFRPDQGVRLLCPAV